MRDIKKLLFWSSCVTLASFAFFYSVFVYNLQSDFQAHIKSLLNILSGAATPFKYANFLYYLTVYVIAFFHKEPAVLFLASSIVLASAVCAKFLITRTLLEKYTRGIILNTSGSNNLLIFLSLLLLLVFSLPTTSYFTRHYYYIGQIPANVWHNSTTIFLMPFAILLFFKSFEQLENPTTRGMFLLAILVILNLLAKPSFFFVFCLTYPLMLLRAFGLNKKFWLNLTPVLLGIILLALQYYAIFKIGYATNKTDIRDVSIAIFRVWKEFSPNIPVSLAASNVFPLTYLIFYWRESLKDRLTQYSIVSYFFALVIFCVFVETGSHLGDGNFFWQTVICSYLLFLVLLIQFIQKIHQSGFQNWKNRLILTAFLLHVFSGILYFIKFLVSGSFA